MSYHANRLTIEQKVAELDMRNNRLNKSQVRLLEADMITIVPTSIE